MGKFVAILRDSYREAVSTWVLQVMLGISALLVLLVASLSFRLVTLDQALTNDFRTLNWAARMNPNGGKPEFLVENMTASNPAEPWASDYAFDVVVRTAGPKELEQARTTGLPIDRYEMRSFLRKQLFYLDKLRVEPVEPKDPKTAAEVRYKVASTGTKTPDRLAWQHEPSVLFFLDLPFYTSSLRENLYRIEKYLVNDVSAWVALFIGVVITAGFVPTLLAKGTLDLYVTKPVRRSELLLYKYVGGLTFVFILFAAAVGGVWLAVGLRTGVWSPNFLAVVPVLTFYFAVLYAVSVTVAVFTRSGLLAILATVLAWAVFWGFGKLHEAVVEVDRTEAKAKEEIGKMRKGEGGEDDLPPQFDDAKRIAGWARTLDKIAHPVLPRTYDLDARGVRLIADGLLTEAERKERKLDAELPPWEETLGVSTAFIAVMLGLSCWRFSNRDG